MAKTNPCQICGEVTAAEFTLAAAFPQASWFALPDGSPQLVTNICEGCLLNAAYQRVNQLAEIQARDGVLEEIEEIEDLGLVEHVPPLGGSPKRRPKPADPEVSEVTAAAEAAPD